jgi:hypothetical protein
MAASTLRGEAEAMIQTRHDSDLRPNRRADWPRSDNPAARKTRINNYIREGLGKLDTDEPIPFVCECNSSDCFSTVWASVRKFDRIRGRRDHGLSAHERTTAPAAVAA